MRKGYSAIACALCLLHGAAWGGLRYENLLLELPDGFKIDFTHRRGNVQLIEMVPEGESVEDWSQMVTTTIVHGGIRLSPGEYLARMERLWRGQCPGSASAMIRQGEENGYAFALWLLSCEHFPDTGLPEMTWLKAIRGNDSFYLVQKAWHRHPEQHEIEAMMHYLKKVQVCDSRLPDRACPAVHHTAGDTGSGEDVFY